MDMLSFRYEETVLYAGLIQSYGKKKLQNITTERVPDRFREMMLIINFGNEQSFQENSKLIKNIMTMNTDYIVIVRALPAQSARVVSAKRVHPIHVCNGYGQHTIREQTNASTMNQLK